MNCERQFGHQHFLVQVDIDGLFDISFRQENLEKTLQYFWQPVHRILVLDLLVIKTAEGKIETDIFCKKTNAHRYFCFESAHPRKIARNIPFTLAQRITRMSQIQIAENNALRN